MAFRSEFHLGSGTPEPDRRTGDQHGWGEGEKYIGSAYTTADAAGKAAFTLSMSLNDPFGNGLVYSHCDRHGRKHVPFSRSLQLTRK